MFVYAAIAFSGLTALGAEVVWTRLLSLLLGATVYTFSIILAVFLTGLWAGSGAGSFLARRVRDPRLALAGCQILLALAIAWTAFTLAYVLPWWPVDPWLATNPWLNFDLDLTRCIRAIFPATLLWGASFPLALAAAAANREDPARLTGEVYAANTAGLHCGRAGVQPGVDSGDRNARLPTGIDLVGGGRRGGCRCAGAFEEGTWRFAGAAGLRGRCWRGAWLQPWARFPGRRSLMAAASRRFCGAWISPSMPKPALYSWARESIHRW